MHCGGGAESEGCFLYVAERDMLSRFPYDSETPSLGKKENLMRISSSGLDRHFTRSLLFLPSGSGFPMDDTLLVSVGSSCNVCHEQHPDYAAVLAYSLVDKQKEVYAKGLRNATFMTLNPVNGKVFATEMGRDNLGDNLPPDEINIIENRDNQPQNYGWPNCYGKNVHDDQFDHNTYIRNPCMLPFETPSFVDLPAHSAPLGLAFIPEEGWPPEYWYNLLVAYHGSWNRSVPTGYKIVRLKMDAKGKYLGTEDFITGWLTDGGKKLGRPVDIKVLPGGVAYISDDSTGVIYRLSQTNSGMDMGTR
jgi:glucose/arabinose dehydrogenase